MNKNNNKDDSLNLSKQLQAYATLGTAFLALAPQQAEADIVYVDIPDNQICVEAGPIDPNGADTSSGSFKYIYLDLDGQDSKSSSFTGQDIYIGVAASVEKSSNYRSAAGLIAVGGYAGTSSKLMGIYTTFDSYYQPRNMPYGATISSAVSRASSDFVVAIGFYASAPSNTDTSSKTGDPAWMGSDFTDIQTTGYLGLEFPITGSGDHYAWIQVTVESEVIMKPGQDLYAKSCITILDYAYNDTSGEKILVGQKEDGGGSVAAIPTLSEWGLLNLALLLMTFGTIYLIQPNFSLRKKRTEE